MSSAAENEREERFKHLLQPIRDLAKNWDVDIASSLEDYLEDLEDITITLDGGASKVNFAEAALLIQGSTSVYSRKVEHVYQLVLRTIEFLTQQKTHQSANAGNAKSGDDNDAGVEDMMFLPLDDVLEEGKHIDIEVFSRRGGHGRRSSVGPIDAYGNVNGHGHGRDEERGGLPGGGGAADISRPPMFLMEQDYGNSFKMSTCAVDQSGALLIEGSTLGSSGGASLSFGGSAGAPPLSRDGAGGGAARACDFWGGLREERGPGGGAEAGLGEDGGQFGGLGGEDDDDSDGGGGDFGGGFGQDDGFDDPEGGERERGQDTNQGLHTPRGTTLGSTGMELRQNRSKEATNQTDSGNSRDQPADPWAPLDAHDPGTSKARPIRKGRTYRLPPQLRKRRSSKKGDDKAEADGEGEEDNGDSWVSHDGRLTTSSPFLGLAYPEFQYVLNRERQRKAAQARLARRQARTFMGREEFLAEALLPTGKAPPNGNGEAGAVDGGGFMGDGGGYGSDGGYSSDGGGGGGGYGDYGDSSDRDGDEYSYNNAAGDGGGQGGYGAGVAPIALEDAFRDKPQTYQDLCRSHIEAFMRGTEKYAHETQLSRRVGAWQEKLEPLMLRQEKRQVFDIHVYGQSVLKRVASALTPSERARAVKATKKVKDKVVEESAPSATEQAEEAEPDLPLVDFGVVVGGKARFDVCRLFLASLQLANNGNVRLFHGDNAAEQESTPFQLGLLSLQDADNMTGSFAPSATTTTTTTAPATTTAATTATASSSPENAPPKKGVKGTKGVVKKPKAGAVRKRGPGRAVGTKRAAAVAQVTA